MIARSFCPEMTFRGLPWDRIFVLAGVAAFDVAGLGVGMTKEVSFNECRLGWE